jgi:hypothetical protein
MSSRQCPGRYAANRNFFSLLCVFASEGPVFVWPVFSVFAGKICVTGRTESEVLKWLLTLVIALLLLGVLSPWLRKLGFGRLPGDIDIQRDGRRYSFPIGSTVMLSLLASLIYWMLR